MTYKALGYVVWHGGKWVLRRRYGHLVPPRGVMAAAVGAAGLGVAALVIARRESS
jgi:hypothetical protein